MNIVAQTKIQSPDIYLLLTWLLYPTHRKFCSPFCNSHQKFSLFGKEINDMLGLWKNGMGWEIARKMMLFLKKVCRFISFSLSWTWNNLFNKRIEIRHPVLRLFLKIKQKVLHLNCNTYSFHYSFPPPSFKIISIFQFSSKQEKFASEKCECAQKVRPWIWREFKC